MHLDDDKVRRLLAGDPETTAAFAEHLASPCDVCEEVLARAEAGTSLLDGATDAALLSLAADRDAVLDEVGFARLKRRMHGARPTLFRRALQPRTLGSIAALAAALLVVVVIGTRQTPYDGVKGDAPVQVELSVAARGPQGGLRAVAPGEAVSADETLYLRYHSSEHARAVLLQAREGAPESATLLGRFELSAGRHDLVLEEGTPVGLDVREDRGPYTLALVAWRWGEPPTTEQLRDALAGRDLPGLGVARFPLTIEAPDHR